jgi:hypothetical protein
MSRETKANPSTSASPESGRVEVVEHAHDSLEATSVSSSPRTALAITSVMPARVPRRDGASSSPFGRAQRRGSRLTGHRRPRPGMPGRRQPMNRACCQRLSRSGRGANGTSPSHSRQSHGGAGSPCAESDRRARTLPLRSGKPRSAGWPYRSGTRPGATPRASQPSPLPGVLTLLAMLWGLRKMRRRAVGQRRRRAFDER